MRACIITNHELQTRICFYEIYFSLQKKKEFRKQNQTSNSPVNRPSTEHTWSPKCSMPGILLGAGAYTSRRKIHLHNGLAATLGA